MKKAILFLIIACISEFVIAQTTNYEMIFRYHQNDTVLNRIKINQWSEGGNFPIYLKWKDAPYALQPSNPHGIGLFTDSTTNFTTGQDVGWAYIKVASTGDFINDYYVSNICMFVNDSETPNVQILSTSQGLKMQALTNIGPNTEIKARYQDILDLFPNDATAKFLMQYK